MTGRGDALRQDVETPAGDRHFVPRNHRRLREQLAPSAAPPICDQPGGWDLDHRQATARPATSAPARSSWSRTPPARATSPDHRAINRATRSSCRSIDRPTGGGCRPPRAGTRLMVGRIVSPACFAALLGGRNELYPLPINHQVGDRASGEKQLSRGRRTRCQRLRPLN